MRTEYHTLLFDLDGTITDSSEGITNSVMYALEKFGIVETDREKLCQFIGPPLSDSFQKYYQFSEEKALEAIFCYREYYADKGLYENRVYEGLEETLKGLKKAGKRLIVATSKPEVYARRIMDYFELTPYFDYIAGMELDGGRGSKAEVIEYALDVCKMKDKTKVLMVGDRRHDVEGAHRVGIDCLGVLYGFGSLEELEMAGADGIAEHPEDILRMVR